MGRRGSALVMTAIVAVAACSSDDSGNETTEPDTVDHPPPIDLVVPDVEVTGPVTGGEHGVPYNPMPEDFADRYGYVEEEYFLRGEATAYTPQGELGTDGVWTAEPAGTAPYTTRALVRRPEDPDDFNGIVVVEWFNVTAGRDSDPDFGFLYPVLLEEGYAYVGVSAQQTGVGGGGGAILEVPGVPAEALLPLKEWDPERYAPLDHPGDDYSYDIFTQVAQLAYAGELVDGMIPEYVIGVGESQSAGRLVTYVNAVQPVAPAYDGFLIHSRGDSGAPVAVDAPNAPPDGVTIRTDLDVPVLQFETETDLTRLGFLAARQPDTDLISTWEVAGTAHADQATLDYGQASGEVWLPGASVDFSSQCGLINDGPQAEVLRAGFTALVERVDDGPPPPSSPLIEASGEELVRDQLGNVVGGIRTPAVDAPVAALSGESTAESVFCSLFGATAPFSDEQLAQLYPTHDDYVDAVTESADAAVEAGFLLPADRDALVEDAELS